MWFNPPQTDDHLQQEAIAALTRFSAPEAAEALLGRWSSFPPARKAQVLDACLGRKDWTKRLLEAVAAKRIPAAEIDVTRTQQLLTHADPGIRELAARALAATVNADRRRVIDEYQSALTLAGDSARGREVFTKSCANCHKLGDLGHAVGPDLAALSDRPPETLLVSVLDSNLAVEVGARYSFADDIDGSNPTNENLENLRFGNLLNNDWYMFTGFTLTYTFGEQPCYCFD